jgi:hypothetical protein
MKAVKKPDFDANETYTLCISRVRNKDLRTRLEACTDLINEAESEFVKYLASGKLHKIVKEAIINKNINARNLVKLYDNSMAKKKAPGRPIYDKIFSEATLGLCPFCFHRDVETLDHFLPKATYPRLAVTPINLIPSCWTCNNKKSTNAPSNYMEELLHPYFDKIENDPWLYARVIQSSPPSVEFFVIAPSSWDDSLKLKTQNSFKIYELKRLYAVQAAVLLASIRKKLEDEYKRAGRNGVKTYLEGEAESRVYNDQNSWQSAFYMAISKDDWFCDGGFYFDNN